MKIAAIVQLVASVAFSFIVCGIAFADEPPLTVKVLELDTGNPIPGATVIVMSSPYDKVRAVTGDDGVAHVVPKGATNLVVQADGYAPVRRYTNPTQLAAENQSVQLVMEHGTRIGGMVVDQDGKPVADATVMWSAEKVYADGKEMLDTLQRTTKTGPDGKWSYDHLPADATHLAVGAYHPEYLKADPEVKLSPVANLAALQDGSWKCMLTHGVPISVDVTGPDGKAVAGARVNYGPMLVPISVRPIIETDANGHVEVGVPADSQAVLTVTAKGLAPELEALAIGKAATSASFQLKPAATIAGHVVDGTGAGIPDAIVRIDSWRGFKTIGVTNGIRTDADGAFSWSAAPTDAVQLIALTGRGGRSPSVPAATGEAVQIVVPTP